MDITLILTILHSAWRWVLVVVTLVAAVFFLVEWLRNRAFNFPDRRMLSIFTNSIDIQVLLGILLLLWSGLTTPIGFPMYRVEHAVTMIIAAIVAHLGVRWRETPMPGRARNLFFVVLATLILIIIGVARLPLGWTVRM